MTQPRSHFTHADGLRLHALVTEIHASTFALGDLLNERVFSHGDAHRLRSIGA